MAQETAIETAADLVRAFLTASTEASSVPLVVEDEATLLDVARRLHER